MQNLLFFAAAFFLVQSGFAQTASPSSTVTIPITEYLDLKKLGEHPKVTSIEEVKLRGTFGKNLTISFTGRCTGGFEPRDILELSDNYSLSSCKGEALLDAQESTIRLVPLAPHFTLTCDLRAKNWNEFELNVLSAFAFSGEVTGAEIISESEEAGHRKIALNPRQAPTSRTAGQITGVAKYRLTVEPEEISFRYNFRLNNPSRSTRPFDIHWVNGEIIQKARGLASYQEAENSTRFNLNPGENDIEVKGRFPGTGFKPVLASAQQYLLIESHPTLQLAIETKGRRISNTDGDLRPKYNNARLYTFGKETDFSWTTRKLEVLEAMGYSISSAAYSYYVPEYGKPIVEARFTVNNQGTPEVSLDVPGVATYLEVGGVPQVLYKGGDGKLLVQLPAGITNVYLQYRPQNETGVVLSGQRADLVKPNAVLSNVSVNLLTPAKWKVLFGSSLVGARSAYDVRSIFCALLLGLLFYGAGTLWKFNARKRRIMAASGALLGFLSLEALLFFAATAVFLWLARHRAAIWKYLSTRPIRMGLAACGLVVALFVFLPLTAHFTQRSASQLLGKSMANYNQAQAPAPAGAPMPEKAASDSSEFEGSGSSSSGESGSAGGAGIAVGVDERATYQGLPAKLEIPNDVGWTSFSQSMVDSQGKIVLRTLLLSASIINALMLGSLLLCLFTLLSRRRTIWDWVLAH